MKCLNLCFTASLMLISFSMFAQSPKQIEADLLKTFKSIDYYAEKHDEENLANADDLFIKKLAVYTSTVPATISYPFNKLKKERLSILTSTDRLFRIYSWDDGTGGTMRYFDNVFQYQNDGKTASIINVTKSEGDIGSMYEKLYTFKANGKTYYLATELGIGSTIIYARGIQVFSIENGKLNTNTKIIRTKSGLHSRINYDYDLSKSDFKVSAIIYFDPSSQSIHVPIVTEEGRLTKNYILYKFTGQYFERVKN